MADSLESQFIQGFCGKMFFSELDDDREMCGYLADKLGKLFFRAGKPLAVTYHIQPGEFCV